eukprot:scaffold30.g4431.t1
MARLVRASEAARRAPTVTVLVANDQMRVQAASCRATFWPGGRFDADVLQRALQLTLDDMPFLAGRLSPLALGGRLADVHILHTNAGVPLLGPDSWPVQRGDRGSLPPYIEPMDTRLRMLRGKEPLLKVRLTRLANGDVLAFTLSHVLADGMRLPALLAHLAARYRQAAAEAGGGGGGGPPPFAAAVAEPGLLMHSDRSSALSAARLLEALPGQAGCLQDTVVMSGGTWRPAPLAVRPGLGDHWRSLRFMLRDARRRADLVILHVPRPALARLKAGAEAALQAFSDIAGSAPPGRISMGDVAQALGGMLYHAASGQPLIPRPSSGKHQSSLFAAACAIRRAQAAFRAEPEAAVVAMANLEALVKMPSLTMLAYIRGQRVPLYSSCTNYIPDLPADKALDFGFGLPAWQQWATSPLLEESMVVIRPAQPPYSEGLFFYVSLTAAQLRRLDAHALLPSLAPTAAWVGAGGSRRAAHNGR